MGRDSPNKNNRNKIKPKMAKQKKNLFKTQKTLLSQLLANVSLEKSSVHLFLANLFMRFMLVCFSMFVYFFIRQFL